MLTAAPALYRGTEGAALPPPISALVAHCDLFLPLDEHARRICQRAGLPPHRAAAVQRRLETLAAAGLLTSAEDVRRRVRAQSGPPVPREPIALIGVPSCDRPQEASRALRSYMRNTRDHGRDVEFVLVDDSRRAESRDRNRAELRALAREWGTRVAYAGDADRESYGGRLAEESGVARDTVRFALTRTDDRLVSTGASRNVLLLHAVGDRFVHVDDDTLCNLAPAQGAEPGLALAGVHVGMEHSFYATNEEARAAVSFGRQDYVGLYDAVLGRTVADVLAGAPADEPLDLDGAGPDFLRRLEEAACPIVAASLGVAGDSGLGSSEMYFFTGNPVSRHRLFGFEGGYRRAFESQQVVRSTRRTTLAQTGFCVGIALGLDHRALLPPFMPVMRNSDGAFSKVRRACFPDTAMAFLPWVVEHVPPVVRRSSLEGVLASAGRAGLPEFLSWFIRSLDDSSLPRQPARRLAALGARLSRIGSLRPPEYADECRHLLRQRLQGVTDYVERFEARCGEGPPGWREDLAAYVARLREATEAVEAVAPADLVRAGLDPAHALLRGQALMRSYGELLRAWPDIVEAARTLRRRGHRPARRLD